MISGHCQSITSHIHPHRSDTNTGQTRTRGLGVHVTWLLSQFRAISAELINADYNKPLFLSMLSKQLKLVRYQALALMSSE